MAKSSTRAQRARDTVSAAGSNPYLRRLIEDEDLRDSVRDAVDAARDAYERLSSNGNVIDTAIDDKKVHKDLKTAAQNLRDASGRLRGEEKKRHWGRLIVIAILGAVAGAGSERGPAQEAARCDVRGRGGVRVHLDHLAGLRERAHRRLTESVATGLELPTLGRPHVRPPDRAPDRR